MVWIVLFAVLASACTVGMLHYRTLYLQEKANADQWWADGCALYQKYMDLTDQEHRRRERCAYQAGLYDARTTDDIYRSLLRKQQNGESFTVMMTRNDNLYR